MLKYWGQKPAGKCIYCGRYTYDPRYVNFCNNRCEKKLEREYKKEKRNEKKLQNWKN